MLPVFENLTCHGQVIFPRAGNMLPVFENVTCPGLNLYKGGHAIPDMSLSWELTILHLLNILQLLSTTTLISALPQPVTAT